MQPAAFLRISTGNSASIRHVLKKATPHGCAHRGIAVLSVRKARCFSAILAPAIRSGADGAFDGSPDRRDAAREQQVPGQRGTSTCSLRFFPGGLLINAAKILGLPAFRLYFKR